MDPLAGERIQIDPSRAQLYEQHYYTVDPWNRHAMSSQIGRVTLTHKFMRDADFQRSEFYQDYLRQSDIFYALGTVVERTTDHMAVFGVQCGHRKGPFSQETADMANHIDFADNGRLHYDDKDYPRRVRAIRAF